MARASDPDIGSTSRLRSVPMVRDGSRSVHAALSVLSGRVALVLGLLWAILEALPGKHQGWQLVAALALCSAAAGVVLVRRPGLIPMPVLDAMLVGADAGLVVLAKYAPALEPAFPCIVMIIGCVLFALRSWPAIVGHIALIGAAYGAILDVGPPLYSPTSRWVAVMTILTVMGLYMRWLVSTVVGLAADERRARAQTEAASDELVRESQAKSQFLARMSHELRTPLNAVLGFSELLGHHLVGPLNQRQSDYVGDITDSARHLVTLVDDVLDLTEVERGATRLVLGPTDIASVVEESTSMLRDRAAAKGVELTVAVDPGLPEATADGVKIRQVVLNLVANAVRFTPAGGSIQVHAGMTATGLFVAVEDTGIGVPAEDQERIFEEYAQAAEATGGTGLGLPLARRLVELHGGALTLRSRLGGGSVFEFDLPLRADGDANPPESDSADIGADYSAITKPGSIANRELIGLMSLRLWFAGAGLVIVLSIITPWPWTGRVSATSAAIGLLGLATVFRSKIGRLKLRTVELTAYASIALICILTVFVNGIGDVVAVGFGWMTMLTFSLWPMRRAIIQLATASLAYGLTLEMSHPPLAAAHWLSVMTMLVFNSAIVGSTSARLRALVVAEQSVHSSARRVSAELATTSRHKSEFLANMSHELRTPLTAIIGFADLIAGEQVGPLNAAQRDYIGEVRTAAHHLLAIINDVLDSAKIDAGQLQLDLDVISVRQLLQQAIDIAAPRGVSRDTPIDLEIAPEATFVVAGRYRLEQVFVQLIANAVKFTPSGGLVRVSACVMNDNELHLSVTDSGIGIAPEQLPSIFDAFHQGTRLPEDHVRVGTGLGLSLAKSIVEMHGGRIWATSVPDHGSTFTVALPMLDPVSQIRAAASARADVVATAQSQRDPVAQSGETVAPVDPSLDRVP